MQRRIDNIADMSIFRKGRGEVGGGYHESWLLEMKKVLRYIREMEENIK